MTEMMNYFQTFFMTQNYTPVNLNTAEVELAVALKAEAEQFALIAETETRNGKATSILAFEATTPNKRRSFTEIAVWHNTRAAEKYLAAASRFEEAGRVYSKKIRAFNAKAREMRRCAEQAEAALGQLNEFLKQN